MSKQVLVVIPVEERHKEYLENPPALSIAFAFCHLQSFPIN